jgi:hypothetical protein
VAGGSTATVTGSKAGSAGTKIDLSMSIGGKLFLLACAPLALYATSFFEPDELRRLRLSLSNVRRWSTARLASGGGGQ